MYTTSQVAKLLNYANDAVIRLMIKQGRIKAEKFGHIWMITKRELNRISKLRK